MYGLVGRMLGGSFSAAWFGERGVDYRNFELDDISELPALLYAHPGLRGFNVTHPYKDAVLRYIDTLDPIAAAVGAVNCVAVRAERGTSRRLAGYNTDALALREVLAGVALGGGAALILGSGGAAKAAAWALKELGVDFLMVSRTAGDIRFSDLTPDIIAGHRLIINATPVGERPPLPYDSVSSGHVLFDMIYNPAETPFLRAGRELGAHTENGLGMLVRQAELSCEVWGLQPDAPKIPEK